MQTLEKFFLGAFGLILVFLILSQSDSFNTVIKSLSSGFLSTFGLLQGREVSGYGVNVGGLVTGGSGIKRFNTY